MIVAAQRGETFGTPKFLPPIDGVGIEHDGYENQAPAHLLAKAFLPCGHRPFLLHIFFRNERDNRNGAFEVVIQSALELPERDIFGFAVHEDNVSDIEVRLETVADPPQSVVRITQKYPWRGHRNILRLYIPGLPPGIVKRKLTKDRG